MPTNHFIEFLLFIIPGFIYVNTYQKFHPVAKKSQFFEVANTTVFGILIYAITTTLGKNIFHFHLQSNATTPSIKFVLALLLLGILFGVIMHYVYKFRFWASKNIRFLKFLNPAKQTIWEMVNQKDITDWAVIYLSDGAIYMGYIRNFSYNPDLLDQEFLLGPARRVNEDLKEQYSIDGIGVYLNTREVKRIEFIKGEFKNPG